MARPLKFTSGSPNTLQEFSDSQLEHMVYILQTAYAAQLDNSGNGYIFVGTGATSIGSAVDTVSNTQLSSGTAAPPNNGVQSYPAAPGILSGQASGTFNYSQDRNVPTYPSAADIDSKGFVILDGNNNLKVPASESEWVVANGIIDQTVAEIRNGNEVGSYRISASAPTDGGAGTWKDKGTWFFDDKYDNVGEIDYKLWLKMSLTTVPGSSADEPIGITGTADGTLKNRETNSTLLGIYADVLLPILTRRLSAGDLQYTVSGTATNSRGVFYNTEFNTSVDTNTTEGTSGAGEIYYTRSTPDTSGSSTTVSTYYLNMS